MIAFFKGNLNVIKLLITKGADIEAKLNETAETFFSANPRKYIKTYNGSTSIILAAQQGNYEICKFLVESGCDINAKSENGYALDAAEREEHWEIVNFLKPLM